MKLLWNSFFIPKFSKLPLHLFEELPFGLHGLERRQGPLFQHVQILYDMIYMILYVYYI